MEMANGRSAGTEEKKMALTRTSTSVLAASSMSFDVLRCPSMPLIEKL